MDHQSSGGQPPGGLHRRVDTFFQWVELAATGLAGIMVLAAMVLTSLDVFMRYVFHSPLVFNYHLTEFYLMVGMMALPMAWGFRTGGYIRVMALAGALPPTPREILLRAGIAVSLAYAGLLTWLTAGETLEYYQRGDVNMGVIDWPVWLSWLAIPVGLALLSVRLLLILVQPVSISSTIALSAEDVA